MAGPGPPHQGKCQEHSPTSGRHGHRSAEAEVLDRGVLRRRRLSHVPVEITNVEAELAEFQTAWANIREITVSPFAEGP